ncbi:MAG: heavy metal translocating P-type ATPase, partial [Vulcanimicrobiaceae bacterium]
MTTLQTPPQAVTELSISGMTCASCVAHVTRALNGVPGVHEAAVNLATEHATIAHDPSTETAALIEAIERSGYRAVQATDNDADAERTQREFIVRRRLLVLAIACFVPTLVLGMFVGSFPYKNEVLFALTLPVWAIVGWVFHRGALAALRSGTTTMDTLVSLGSTAAFALSIYEMIAGSATYFETASAIVTLVFAGKYLEAAARSRSNRALRGLLSLRPEIAHRRSAGGDIEAVAVDSVNVGDSLVVAPGERIPVDGVVESGQSSLDRALLTGEAMPVDIGPGDPVEQGTINGSGALVMRATAVGSGTTLARIVQTVRQAQGSTPPVQRLADRIASIFVPVILAFATMTYAGWILTHHGWTQALVSAIAVLVVACPCALGLATPTAIIAGVGAAARRGILFKDAAALERAAAIATMIFDKTGTLTQGSLRVLATHPNEGTDANQMLQLAAALEAMSTHPIAQAIVTSATGAGLARVTGTAIAVDAGRGISGTVDGDRVLAGNAAYMRANGIETNDPASRTTRIYVARGGAVMGNIELGDSIRPNARATVDALRALHVTSVLVSGDGEGPVQAVASSVGIERWHATVLPIEKADIVMALQSAGTPTGFIGDGINDAPALARADVGFAMGGGTAIAL